jgi:hypothetical protein
MRVIKCQINTICWHEAVSTEELLHYLWRRLHTHSRTHSLTEGGDMLLLHDSRPDCLLAATIAVHVEPRFHPFFPHHPYSAFPHPSLDERCSVPAIWTITYESDLTRHLSFFLRSEHQFWLRTQSGHPKLLRNVQVEGLALVLRMRDVLCSNFGPENSHWDRDFHSSPQTLQEN